MTRPSRLRAHHRLALAPALVLVTAAGAGAQVPALAAGPRGPVGVVRVDTAETRRASDGRGPVAGVTIAPRDARPREAAIGTTFSVALVVRNDGPATATLAPRILAPAGWSVVTGAVPFTLAAGETDPWIVAVRVPATAAAGPYVVPVVARVGTAGELHDSLRITVPVHRALGVEVAERPEYAIAGRPYAVRYVVRNDGNAPIVARLAATASVPGAVTPDVGTLALLPGERRTVAVRGVARLDANGSADELVALSAIDVERDTVEASATAAVALVGRPGAGPARFTTVPAQLRLRLPGPGVAVSHAELTGGGPLGGGAPAGSSVEFLVRAPVRDVSGGSSFYERDEYRLRVRTPGVDVDVGDAFHSLSTLTGGGLPGMGGRVDVRGSALAGGAYAQQARWSSAGEVERGAYLAARGSGLQVGAQVVERQGGVTAGRIASVRGALTAHEAAQVAVEIGHGSGPFGAGMAVDARVGGRAGPLSYDAGHLHADRAYAGPVRGTASDFASADLRVSDALRIGANATAQRNDFGVPGVAASLGSREAGLTATLLERVSLAAERSSRSEIFGAYRVEGTQDVARVRGTQPFGSVNVTASAEAGRTHDRLTGARGDFRGWGLAADAALASGRNVGVFVDVNDGGSLARRGPATTSVGVQGDLALPLDATIRLATAGTRVDDGGGWRLWTDATAERRVGGADAVRLHLRQLAQPAAAGAGFGRPQFYLEYVRGVRMPAGRARQVGVARGRVTDAATGRGVGGALVRVGDRAAVTDERGWATLAGLDSGDHPVRLAGAWGAAGALAAGDQFVRVDGTTNAARFVVAVARGARVRASVRRLEVARSGLGSAPDSLADVGGLADVAVRIASARDTLVARTGPDGTVDFGDVAPGHYVVTLASAPEGGHRAELARAEVAALAGGVHAVTLGVAPPRMVIAEVEAPEVEIPVVTIGGARPSAPTSDAVGPTATPAVGAAATGRMRRDARSSAATTTVAAARRDAPLGAPAPTTAAIASGRAAGTAESGAAGTTGAAGAASASGSAAAAGAPPSPRDARRAALMLFAVLAAAVILAVVARRLLGPRR